MLAVSRHPRPLSQTEFLGTIFKVCSTASGGPFDARDLIRDLPNSIQHNPEARKFWRDKRQRINYVLSAARSSSKSRLSRYTSKPAPVLSDAIDQPNSNGWYRRMSNFARYCLNLGAGGVKYLDKRGRRAYEVAVDSDGRLIGPNGRPLSTCDMWTQMRKGGWGIFVVDNFNRMYTGSHRVGRFHHSSFLSGAPVKAAGEWLVKDGKVFSPYTIG